MPQKCKNRGEQIVEYLSWKGFEHETDKSVSWMVFFFPLQEKGSNAVFLQPLHVGVCWVYNTLTPFKNSCRLRDKLDCKDKSHDQAKNALK